MHLQNRIARLAMVCLFVAPCAARADVVYTHRLNGTTQNSGPNFSGGTTTVTTRFFSDYDGANSLDLTGASGDLIVQLLAPVGKKIEIAENVTLWTSAMVLDPEVLAGAEVSLPISITPGFVDLSAGAPAITSSGGFYRADASVPGNLAGIRMGTLDGAFGPTVVLPAGTQFSGVSFRIPIAQLQANFSGFDLMFGRGVANPFFNFLFNSEAVGDQRSTMGTVAARFVDAADVPEPGTGLLMSALLGLSGIVKANRRP